MDWEWDQITGNAVRDLETEEYRYPHICRLQLAKTARDIARGTTLNERATFIQQCERLAAQINTHEQRANTFLVSARAGNDMEPVLPIDLGAEWDDLDNERNADIQRVAEVDDIEDILPPYRLPIALPSTLSKEEVARRGLENALCAEMDLRKGQAEDRLAELRVLLDWKSAIFRTKVRPAGSYNARTRAWAEVRSIAAAVQKNARAYELARKTMWRCSDAASEEGKAIRQCFQPLTKHDLKVSTEYILPEIRGARNTAQSWIWNSGATKDIQDNAWLEECMLLFSAGVHLLTYGN